MNFVMLFVHLTAVIILMGGVHLFVVALRTSSGDQAQVATQAFLKFRKIMIGCLIALFLSGGHLTFASGVLHQETAFLLIIKIALALPVLGFGFLLTIPDLKAIQEKRDLYLKLFLLAGFVVIFLGALINSGHLPEKIRG